MAAAAASVATGLAITNPLVKYRALLATKSIAPDPAQHRLAVHLAKLYDRLKDYEPELEFRQRIDQISRVAGGNSNEGGSGAVAATPLRQSWRSFLAATQQERSSLALTRHFTSHEAALQLDSPRGLMLHGEVGTGKSMLIDLFAECLPNRKKRRWHFNTFMLETFSRLEVLRQQREVQRLGRGETDEYPLLWLAREMILDHPILFLDEFQMPDRVASKILTNLMTAFFQLGGVLLATSNRMPEELDKAAGVAYSAAPTTTSLAWQLGFARRPVVPLAGRNEFGAFLEVLKARCDVWEIESARDYRRLESGKVASMREIEAEEEWRLDGHDDLQHSIGMPGWPAAEKATATASEKETSEEPSANDTQTTLPVHFNVSTDTAPANTALDRAIAQATSTLSATWEPATMTVYGRTVSVPRTCNGATLWTFDELCKATFGPADYISLASTYHTLLLTDVPVLSWLQKNEARRFINLLDALYECRCKLHVLAAAGPDDLFFPDEQKQHAAEGDSGDAVYSETLAEVYQDATAPFRPNVLSDNPNYAEPDPEPDYTHARLKGLLNADALEDDPPNQPRRTPFGRSFGLTDAELMERRPVDPDDDMRGLAARASRPDFQRTGAFTGEDERFAYKRAQSRLWELCSARWWARDGVDWHRPLPHDVRRWEQTRDSRVAAAVAPAISGAARSDIAMGPAVEDHSRDPRSFKTFSHSQPPARVAPPPVEAGAGEQALKGSITDPPEELSPYSPFRITEDPPPKFSWAHIWGTVKWGPKAGAWGQGPEGLKDRRSKKE